jgi:hypothetical protein
VARFPTRAHYFASYAGAAPVEASSGEVVRYRLSSLALKPPPQQSALHMVAVCQARSDARGGTYYRKKIAEGKSRKEALPQEAHLRCRLQEPHGRFQDAFAQRCLTKRSRELRKSEFRLPRRG